MKLMSFALTTDQVRARTKTVTRRLGWKNAKPGDVVQPIVKGQGLKKGEKVERIGGPIRFVKVTRQQLSVINARSYAADLAKEGFPTMTSQEFIRMFAKHNGCNPNAEVTRIEFEYLEPEQSA